VQDALSRAEKEGYRFTYKAHSPDSQGNFTKFSIIARPIEWQEGMRSFYIDESGVLRQTTENRPAAAEDTRVKLIMVPTGVE